MYVSVVIMFKFSTFSQKSVLWDEVIEQITFLLKFLTAFLSTRLFSFNQIYYPFQFCCWGYVRKKKKHYIVSQQKVPEVVYMRSLCMGVTLLFTTQYNKHKGNNKFIVQNYNPHFICLHMLSIFANILLVL